LENSSKKIYKLVCCDFLYCFTFSNVSRANDNASWHDVL